MPKRTTTLVRLLRLLVCVRDAYVEINRLTSGLLVLSPMNLLGRSTVCQISQLWGSYKTSMPARLKLAYAANVVPFVKKKTL